MEDHYKILGIQRSATPEEVKKAYFVMAKKYHPDAGDQTEIQKFHEVAKAYKVLSDKDARKVYDLSLGPVDEPAKKVEAKPVGESVSVSKREAYRDDELKEFHRNRYKKAVFRVVLFSLLIGVVAGTVGALLSGNLILAAVAGVCIGFSFSINQNFDVRSFFKSDRLHKSFRVFTWLLFLGGLGYFGWLVVTEVLF